MPEGYTLGGGHIHDFAVEMNEKRIPSSPPINNKQEDQGGKDGAWDFGMEYGPKIIEVDHHILADTKNERQDMIRGMTGFTNPRKGSQELIFDDEPDKMYLARLYEQFTMDQVVGVFASFTLQYICHDPFTYSVQEKTATIINSGVINHLGNHVSSPILVIDHGGGSAIIGNVSPDGNEQEMEFEASSIPGQYVVNMKEGTIKIGQDGGDKYIKRIEWFEMGQGDNTITHDANVDQIVVRYRDTWL